MAASDHTIREVLGLIYRYVRKQDVDNLIDDLTTVPGNASFRATVKRLAEHHATRRKT